jgi:hypothetical protein
MSNRFSHKKGSFGHAGKDDGDFLIPSTESDQWKASGSGHGYNAKFSDDDGFKRGEQSRAGDQAWQSRGADDASFLRNKSQSQTYEQADGAEVHERLSRLIDNDASLPADKMLTGGGNVSANLEAKDSHRRYKLGTGRLRDHDDGGL